MSLDIYLLTTEKCPHCQGNLPGLGSEIHSQNYTHNVTPMWSKAGVYDALYMSEGLLVDEKYLETLKAGISDFEKHLGEYVKLNPANGWGSAETALPWLEKWHRACAHNIGATIHVSK